MYCNKCGKEIANGTLCDECKEPKVIYYAQPDEGAFKDSTDTENTEKIVISDEYMSPMPDPKNRMYGFGKALTSTIMSEFAFVIAYLAMFLSMVSPVAGWLLVILALPLIIVSLCLGINSIKTFKRRKATCAKPIPTLVLGINGTVMSGCAAIMEILAFFYACIFSMIGLTPDYSSSFFF